MSYNIDIACLWPDFHVMCQGWQASDPSLFICLFNRDSTRLSAVPELATS